MKIIYFVSDFFIPEVYGGAEKYNDALISEFFNKKYNDFENYIFVAISSPKLTLEIINKNPESTYFIANFMNLPEESKKELISKNIDYIIIEHDHKYLESNNPAIYDNFLSNEEGLQNIDFYKNARAVLCQSRFASEILYKNIQLNNLVNLEGNLWSESDINFLKDLLEKSRSLGKRPNKWGVLRTDNSNKGFEETVDYCHNNMVPHTYIGSPSFKQFMGQVVSCEGVILFPKWIETFNRYLVEARALGCKVMTNKKVGCVQDGWMEYKEEAMIEKMRSSKERIFEVYDKLVNKKQVEYFNLEMPRVTIITTFVEAEEYIEQYLEEITKQTIFDEIDLLIYDAGSSGNESKIISKYVEKFSNIFHIRDEKKITSSEAFNKMIEYSKNEYIGMIMIDDRPAPEYSEKLRKHLHFSGVDLVYGDCVQTYQSNDKVDSNFYTNNNLYEHSKKEFSRENMIKCLPGPMPMFRKSMIEKNGGFSSEFKHANDWELWLRCVRSGSEFKKVDSRVGLYYFNPAGVTTSAEKFSSKIKEEASLFMEYKDVIGEDNFTKYKQYFSQGLQ